MSSVSVVITNYNGEKYLNDSINSVLNQSFENFEVIIVDDNSTDNSMEICKHYEKQDKRIKIIALNSNFGAPAKPRNIGVYSSNNKFVAFLDSDDIWNCEKLNHQLEILKKSDSLFVSSNRFMFKGDENKYNVRYNKVDTCLCEKKIAEITYNKLIRKNWICTSSVLGSRELFLRYPFVEKISYKAIEDFRCWLEIHKEIKKSLKLLYPYVGYRASETSISKSKLSMVKKNYMLYNEYYPNKVFIKFKVFWRVLDYMFLSLISRSKKVF